MLCFSNHTELIQIWTSLTSKCVFVGELWPHRNSKQKIPCTAFLARKCCLRNLRDKDVLHGQNPTWTWALGACCILVTLPMFWKAPKQKSLTAWENRKTRLITAGTSKALTWNGGCGTRTSTWHPRVWRFTFQKFYIRCTIKGVVCLLFLRFLRLSSCDVWNCRWKFTTGPTVVIMTWDPIAKSWTRNREAMASPTSSIESYMFIRCSFGHRDLAEHLHKHGKATEDATALLQAKKRRLQRWPAKHTTLRSSHTFDVIIFCHLTLDCEIGRASFADSGCDCFKKKQPAHSCDASRISIKMNQFPSTSDS